VQVAAWAALADKRRKKIKEKNLFITEEYYLMMI